MTALFFLSPEQMNRIEPFFPLSHGVPWKQKEKGFSWLAQALEVLWRRGRDVTPSPTQEVAI